MTPEQIEAALVAYRAFDFIEAWTRSGCSFEATELQRMRAALTAAEAKDADTRATVCDEILSIMEEYHRQDARGCVDTPGGLEHMGDVWRMLWRWEEMLKRLPPAPPEAG